jgi:S-adenosylmethionine:tRNA ribosyltransferase-isomerase
VLDSEPLRATDFDFELPPELIAQAPAARREDARLFCLDRSGHPARHRLAGDTSARSAPLADRERGIEHRGVRDLPSLIPEGALLVVNDTRVIPARLYGKKPTGGRLELLLVERLPVALAGKERWRCLGGASKPIRPGPIAIDGEGAPPAEVLVVEADRVDVEFTVGERPLLERLHAIGELPLPPYIRRDAPSAQDRERYQTVYARVPGAVAAPTAGLHFTPELFEELDARGIGRTAITLHVGPGTFAPLRSDDVDAHVMHEERYEIPELAAAAIESAKAAGRPIVAVGTTVVRTLEAAASGGRVRPGPGTTRLFIRPGYRFDIVDQMITNFHLPKSTLLMLVCAFAGRDRMLAAYAEAVRERYRFFSYGDAMYIR